MPSRFDVAMLVGATLLVVLPVPATRAECEGDHGAGDGGRAPAIVVKEGPTDKAKPHVVVIGAPSQSVTVQAPPDSSVSAVGGPGVPGKAGAPGKPAQ